MRLGSLNAASKAKTGDFFHFESAEKKKTTCTKAQTLKTPWRNEKAPKKSLEDETLSRGERSHWLFGSPALSSSSSSSSSSSNDTTPEEATSETLLRGS